LNTIVEIPADERSIAFPYEKSRTYLKNSDWPVKNLRASAQGKSPIHLKTEIYGVVHAVREHFKPNRIAVDDTVRHKLAG
jgi:hypothetical protein